MYVQLLQEYVHCVREGGGGRAVDVCEHRKKINLEFILHIQETYIIYMHI